MDLISLHPVPSEYKQPRSFSWEKYLEETGTQAAPARAFKPVWRSDAEVRVRRALACVYSSGLDV